MSLFVGFVLKLLTRKPSFQVERGCKVAAERCVLKDTNLKEGAILQLLSYVIQVSSCASLI